MDLAREAVHDIIAFSSSAPLILSLHIVLLFPSLLLPYHGGHLVNFTSPFSQSISGLCAINQGIPNITSVLPKLHTVTVVPGPVAVFCMVYHCTKRATLTRLLGNVGPAIYVVLLNKYFVILPVLIQ